MKLRTLASAYIINNEDILLMKRDEKRKFYPGVWAAVGGHIEPLEINNPKEACLREILEESGLKETDFNELNLRYITIRRCKDEIRVVYSYIAFTKTRKYEDKTNEGTLHWINKKEVLNRKMSFTTKKILEHYFNQGNMNTNIYVGNVCINDNIPKINWNVLDDWNGI